MRLKDMNARNATEWTNGYLFFDEELLPDIAKDLERSYDVHIHLMAPELEKLRFYGTFMRKEMSVKGVLDILASTGKIQYTMNGKEINLYPPQ
jgi:ferric-dicitrate binding protein FerR (iron transport regulator)